MARTNADAVRIEQEALDLDQVNHFVNLAVKSANKSGNPCTLCRPDVVVFDPDTCTLRVIEVKTGGEGVTPNQQVVYPDISNGSASLRADQFLAGGSTRGTWVATRSRQITIG
ncbi:MAG: hypothetical protein AB8B85_17290 [Paracoccaceae bacterium]